MFGFDDSGLPIASTGEFPGFVNPMESVTTGESVIRAVDEPVGDELAARRGRRPNRPQ